MGAYLTVPKRDKESENGENGKVLIEIKYIKLNIFLLKILTKS
jgi:hypothetical protein